MDYGSVQSVLLLALMLWILFFCADVVVCLVGRLKRALTDDRNPSAADWAVGKGNGEIKFDEDVDDTDYPMG